MADEQRVEFFLGLVKEAVRTGMFILSGREKNLAFLAKFGVSIPTVKKCILGLSTDNYCSGPSRDLSAKNHNDVWVFGTELENREIYIKLSLGDTIDKVICISFHEAEFPMTYPYGGNNEHD